MTRKTDLIPISFPFNFLCVCVWWVWCAPTCRNQRTTKELILPPITQGSQTELSLAASMSTCWTISACPPLRFWNHVDVWCVSLVYTYALRCPHGAEVQVLVNSFTWVLGTKLGSLQEQYPVLAAGTTFQHHFCFLDLFLCVNASLCVCYYLKKEGWNFFFIERQLLQWSSASYVIHLDRFSSTSWISPEAKPLVNSPKGFKFLFNVLDFKRMCGIY